MERSLGVLPRSQSSFRVLLVLLGRKQQEGESGRSWEAPRFTVNTLGRKLRQKGEEVRGSVYPETLAAGWASLASSARA